MEMMKDIVELGTKKGLFEYILDELVSENALNIRKKPKELEIVAKKLTDFLFKNNGETDISDEERKDILAIIFTYDYYEIFMLNETLYGKENAIDIHPDDYIFLDNITDKKELKEITTAKFKSDILTKVTNMYDIIENHKIDETEVVLAKALKEYIYNLIGFIRSDFKISNTDEKLITSKAAKVFNKYLTNDKTVLRDIKEINDILVDKVIDSEEQAKLNTFNKENKELIILLKEGIENNTLEFFAPQYINYKFISDSVVEVLKHTKNSEVGKAITKKINGMLVSWMENEKMQSKKNKRSLDWMINNKDNIEGESIELIQEQENSANELIEYKIQFLGSLPDNSNSERYLHYQKNLLLDFYLDKIKKDIYKKEQRKELNTEDMKKYFSPGFIKYLEEKEIVYEIVSEVESHSIYQENYFENNFVLLNFQDMFGFEINEPLKKTLKDEKTAMYLYVAHNLLKQGITKDNKKDNINETILQGKNNE